MSAEFFLEIGAEEIPAKEILPALEFLKNELVAGLDELRLAHGPARTYETPRRLCVVVSDVQAKQEDLKKEVQGPPAKVAFKDGKPTKAAEGFAKGLGIEVSALTVKSTDKGEYAYATVEETGQSAHALLPSLVEKAIGKIPFKRSMRWGHVTSTFSRPIQWIVALFGGEVLHLKYADVESGRESRGHRFLSPEAFSVQNEAQYIEELSRRHVLVRAEDRRKKIETRAEEIARSVGGKIRPDAELIDEVVQLIEFPVCMLGKFDERYLSIPQEVLISEMREHQRYLSVVDEKGRLLPYFVVVGNMLVKDERVVVDGYKRVLVARFEDGVFFFNEDQKIRLIDRVEQLKGIGFHRALGSTYEKVERFSRLAFWIAKALASELGLTKLEAPADPISLARSEDPKETASFSWKLARAAALSKADLATKMVFEFPDLQGAMGRAYAQRGNEPDEVADAIADHYRPRFSGDELPRADLGALVGLADRFDTLVGIFSVGKGPTGAADPFGLRRATLGIIHILLGRKWHLSLDAAVSQAIKGLGDKRKKPEDEIKAEVLDFFRRRLKALMTSESIPSDVAEAVLEAGSDDVVDAFSRAEALSTLRQGPEFEPVAISFKRVSNILKDQSPGAIQKDALKEPAERKLLEAVEKTNDRLSDLTARRDFSAAFAEIAALRPTVDEFFNAVLVMHEDPSVRAQRLALVRSVQDLFSPLADFTKLS